MNIGVLGGGQLGRMLALAGYPLGFRFRFLDPAPEAPVEMLAEYWQRSYDDAAVLDDFARGLDRVTYEFESIPVESLRHLQKFVPVHPAPAALEVSQDRLPEKTLFQQLRIPTAKFVPVVDRGDLEPGIEVVGFPAVLKTRRFGYDGKGQSVIRTASDLDQAWNELGGVPLILESFVPFRRELSILSVRGMTGQMHFYPLVENHHRAGILRLSRAPAPLADAELQHTAEMYARKVLELLEYVGVLAIEFFEVDGQLLANEMAPRVHNSGHWTIEGAQTSQFENHLRAIAGLPIGSTNAVGYSRMINLIGTVPDIPSILAIPGTHLHWYGKQPRAQRKLGHVTVWCQNECEADERAAQLAALIEST